ncbi:DUF4352 domain-containing protein [Adlercreutzia murintestinalis]|uniref:DUF4352 domain-containing protein n=1 Tax=Adlercreutzia murintestinalis TaxID=2941325 RepID=UPI0020414F6F|nr:DUF4352 domain-containing protein [Adlercreutzia murintestinalis]
MDQQPYQQPANAPQPTPSQQPTNPQQVPPDQSPQPATPPTSTSTSALGITGLVLGIIALLTSFLPIINNLAALLALLGLVLAIIGLVQVTRGKRSGKGISIAGIIVNVIAFIVVLGTQALFSAALDDALSTNSPTSIASSSSESQASSANDESANAPESFENLALGTAVELDNGMTVQVDAVQPGLANYNGAEVTGITVTYTNNGTSSQSFNVYDWKGEDAQGAQRSTTYYSEAENELNSGSLAAGGSVTGNVYFDGAISKAVYEQLISFDDEVISWTLA